MAYIEATAGGESTFVNLGYLLNLGTTAKTFNLDINKYSAIIMIQGTSFPNKNSYVMKNNYLIAAFGTATREAFTTKWVSSVSGTGEVTITVSELTDTYIKVKADKSATGYFSFIGIP